MTKTEKFSFLNFKHIYIIIVILSLFICSVLDHNYRIIFWSYTLCQTMNMRFTNIVVMRVSIFDINKIPATSPIFRKTEISYKPFLRDTKAFLVLSNFL